MDMVAGDAPLRISGDTVLSIFLAISCETSVDTFGAWALTAADMMVADGTAGDMAGDGAGLIAEGLTRAAYWAALVIGLGLSMAVLSDAGMLADSEAGTLMDTDGTPVVVVVLGCRDQVLHRVGFWLYALISWSGVKPNDCAHLSATFGPL